MANRMGAVTRSNCGRRRDRGRFDLEDYGEEDLGHDGELVDIIVLLHSVNVIRHDVTNAFEVGGSTGTCAECATESLRSERHEVKDDGQV